MAFGIQVSFPQVDKQNALRAGRLEVCLMGCQELLESVPGRNHLANMACTPGSPSDGRSIKLRAGFSGRSANGKNAKADELSCEPL